MSFLLGLFASLLLLLSSEPARSRAAVAGLVQ